MEKNCKWHFGKEGGIDIGPNDPIHQTFKGNPYYSIVREAIQNSLDAVNDTRIPVFVSFQYFELERLKYPSFFQLEEHINQASIYYKSNRDAQRLFGDMIKYLSGREDGKQKLKVSCLKISDTNTKGMHYSEGTDSPFYSFLRAAGVSSKMLNGSGGSFGFGKGAYFALSPIKTLIVSSKDINGKVFFEGATRLTTHKNANGDKITAYGFYDNNNGEPITIEENIPEIFKRTETGTDISIIGLWDEDERETLMIKSVLNNFWLAIHEQKLAVKINDVTINNENLEQVIDEYFPTEYEIGNADEIESWNPKPYYKAVKYSGTSEQFRIFKDELSILGKIKMYVYIEKGLPNRTAHFRSPKMVVYKQTRNILKGYAAVFSCDNEQGNEILRSMENPAHNVWDANNAPKYEGKTDKIARKAEKEINDYVIKTLSSLSKVNLSSKSVFLGLEEFLSIPEDLLEKDDETEMTGENVNNVSGTRAINLSQDETGMQTTNKNEPIIIKPIIRERSEVKEETGLEITEDGTETVTLGGDNKGEGGDKKGNNDGENLAMGKLGDKQKENRVLVSVNLKVAAQQENEILYHTLIINTEQDVTRAELELLVSGDNDKDDGIEIASTNYGSIQGNIIKDIALSAGKNQIKIRFIDNLKHPIKIKAYELQ